MADLSSSTVLQHPLEASSRGRRDWGEWGGQGAQDVLGLETYAAPPSTVELTEAGRGWGLTQPDAAKSCIHVSQATTVLSRAGEWHACAYFKNYDPAFAAGGLLKLKAGIFGEPSWDGDLADLLRAAEFGMGAGRGLS